MIQHCRNHASGVWETTERTAGGIETFLELFLFQRLGIQLPHQ